MEIEELKDLQDEKAKRLELVKIDNSDEAIRLRAHESKKAALRATFAARGEDFDAYLDMIKGTLTDIHKTGGIKLGRPLDE